MSALRNLVDKIKPTFTKDVYKRQGDHHRRPVVVGVERVGRQPLQAGVEEQVHLSLIHI